MTAADLKMIEEELGVSLPQHYVKFILEFKGFGESEYEVERLLYSTPEPVLYWNQMVGFHLEDNDTEIKSKLIVGDNGGGDFYLIDLADPNDLRVCASDHDEGILEYYDDLQTYVNETRGMFGLL